MELLTLKKIGNNVWLTSGCFIMKNPEISDFSVFASGSLVNKKFSDIDSAGIFFCGKSRKVENNRCYSYTRLIFHNKIMKPFSKTGAEFMEMESEFYIENYWRD